MGVQVGYGNEVRAVKNIVPPVAEMKVGFVFFPETKDRQLEEVSQTLMGHALAVRKVGRHHVPVFVFLQSLNVPRVVDWFEHERLREGVPALHFGVNDDAFLKELTGVRIEHAKNNARKFVQHACGAQRIAFMDAEMIKGLDPSNLKDVLTVSREAEISGADHKDFFDLKLA